MSTAASALAKTRWHGNDPGEAAGDLARHGWETRGMTAARADAASRPKLGAGRKKNSGARGKLYRSMRSDGASVKEIALACNVSVGAVYEGLKRTPQV